jgi:shikimate kinase
MESIARGSILLVGMRGSGKSSVGAAVARTLGVDFVDLDAEVLAREGFESVRAMWDAKGQGAFRDAEVRALRALLDEPVGRVLALGGGTPTAPGATELIDDAKREGRAFVVYLRCDLATLESRLRASLAQDANRPSVTGADPVRELSELLRAREPVYRAISDVEVDGDQGTLEEVAARVAALLKPPGDTGRR